MPNDRATMRKVGSKDRIKQFFLSKIGKVVTSIQIRDAAGLSVSGNGLAAFERLREDGLADS